MNKLLNSKGFSRLSKALSFIGGFISLFCFPTLKYIPRINWSEEPFYQVLFLIFHFFYFSIGFIITFFMCLITGYIIDGFVEEKKNNLKNSEK